MMRVFLLFITLFATTLSFAQQTITGTVKKIIVSLPISMDDGSIRVFEGYRVIHSNILGPSKGGIRYDPSWNVFPLTP